MANVNLVNLSFQQLETLVAAVEEGNLSRAARRMHLTQPSVTKHIQHLEEMVGVPLLLRGRKGVSLTPEGKMLLNYARRVLKGREEMAVRLSYMLEGNGAEVVVGASTVPSVYILPRLISRYRSTHPSVTVTVVNSDSAGVVEMVEEGEVAMGFVGYQPSSGRLVSEALWPDRLILVASAGLSDLKGKNRSLSLLRELPFVIREPGSGTRGIMEKWLKEKARLDIHQLKVVAQLGSSEAVKEAVLAGVGVSFLSRRVVERELKLGWLKEIPLGEEEIKRDFYLIYRRSQVFYRHQQLFIEFIRSSAGGEVGE